MESRTGTLEAGTRKRALGSISYFFAEFVRAVACPPAFSLLAAWCRTHRQVHLV